MGQNCLSCRTGWSGIELFLRFRVDTVQPLNEIIPDDWAEKHIVWTNRIYWPVLIWRFWYFPEKIHFLIGKSNYKLCSTELVFGWRVRETFSGFSDVRVYPRVSKSNFSSFSTILQILSDMFCVCVRSNTKARSVKRIIVFYKTYLALSSFP